jgi:aminomethyltransferase
VQGRIPPTGATHNQYHTLAKEETMQATQSLHQTPFHSFHTEHDAMMVDFIGWEMPMHYGSIINEHKQVRESGGLFDVSHMGRLRFKGRDACDFLDRVCTRQIKGIQKGQIRYSLVCNERGGCKDDVLVYGIDDSEFLMVCNGANRVKLLEHFSSVRGDMVFKLKDETESTAMVAIQGPKVMDLLGNFSSEIASLKRYRCTTKNLLLAKIHISRTGYTGEDGVEVILPATFAKKAIGLLLENAEESGIVQPAGLGARDSLRLEAGMPLYGHEITEDIDPLSAGLSFAVKLDKGQGENEAEPFIGQEALIAIQEQGLPKKLIGLKLEGKRTPRQGMPLVQNGTDIGKITSGCLSPTFGYPIAIGLVDSGFDHDSVEIDFGKKSIEATVAPLPFYKR